MIGSASRPVTAACVKNSCDINGAEEFEDQALFNRLGDGTERGCDRV
jgi:hypothetical protein